MVPGFGPTRRSGLHACSRPDSISPPDTATHRSTARACRLPRASARWAETRAVVPQRSADRAIRPRGRKPYGGNSCSARARLTAGPVRGTAQPVARAPITYHHPTPQRTAHSARVLYSRNRAGPACPRAREQHPDVPLTGGQGRSVARAWFGWLATERCSRNDATTFG